MMPPPETPADSWSEWLRGRMFDRRVVSLTGDLDDALASRVAAELMILDATGDGVVRLLVDSGGGTLDAGLTLIDVVDLLGVPVHATCVGRAEGAALGVLAVAARRTAAPHARFRLCEPAARFDGRPHDVAAWADHRDRQVRRYCERLAAACGRPVDTVAAAMRDGVYLDAEDARRYGLVDEIGRPQVGSVHRFDDRPLGFRSRPTRSR